MHALRLSLGLLLLIVSSTLAIAQTGLVGNWKLISSHVSVNNQPPSDYPGPNPKGYLLLTAEGRMMALMTSAERKFGSSDAELAQLWRSMLAYSGKYRIEGGDFVTLVDASWIEAWNGTEQRRHYRLEGDRLTIVTDPTPTSDGRVLVGTLVWERER